MTELGKTIDFESALRKRDLTWDKCPTSWYDAAFLGNGLIGATIFSCAENQLCWKVSRTDVTDHREGTIPLYGKRRLPVGELVLETVGKIESASMRQDLYNAEVRCAIITDKGTITLTSLIHSEDMCLFINMEATGEESDALIFFCEQPPVCTELHKPYFADPEEFYRHEANAHPMAEAELCGDLHILRQCLIDGSAFATVWCEKRPSEEKRQIYLSIGNGKDKFSGTEDAKKSVLSAVQKDKEKWICEHRKEWHAFFEKSYISIPNKRLESLYWIQLYKLNSATRENRPAIDLLGPWYLDSPWQIIWWNLNVELTYWPVYASNHLELGESLCRLLDGNIDNLSLNVPEEYRHDSAAIGRTTSFDCLNDDLVGIELCDLPFACHNYYLQCRYSMDMERTKEKFYPLLKRAMMLYIHLLKKDEKGIYHLPKALSPEYPVWAEDTNCDIAFLRWGLSLLLELSEKFNLNDEMVSTWKEVLENLVDYQIDENGLMVGKDVPFNQTHRHYTHLFAIYPLYLINWDDEEKRDLIVKSLETWMSYDEKLQGYSYTGAASIYASIGEGNPAEEYLEKLMGCKIYPNTFYAEKGPCIETPLSAAKSVQDMLLQSWGDKIRIFPALPDKWENASFYQLRCEGAFLASAVKEDGRVKFVHIKSTKGGISTIVPGFGKAFSVDGNGYTVLDTNKEEIKVDFEKDGEILLWSTDEKPQMNIPIVKGKDADNYYGSGAYMPPIRK